jgi:hypothetical protein
MARGFRAGGRPGDVGECDSIVEAPVAESPVREIRLWRNVQAQDWPVEIDGLRHEHISSEILEDLGEPALIVGEE